MTIDDIFKEIDHDSIINLEHLDEESLNIPKIHSKWYKNYVNEYEKQRRLEAKIDILRVELMDYYLGKSTDEVYLKKPYPYEKRITKQDLELYINVDEDYQLLKEYLSQQRVIVTAIQDFIRNVINTRAFHIRAAIDFIKVVT